jgi:hypothetical protein
MILFTFFKSAKATPPGLYGGKIDRYRYEVSVVKTPTPEGINNGKIVKLCIWDSEKGINGGCIVDYNSVWLLKPRQEYEPYIRRIMQLYK